MNTIMIQNKEKYDFWDAEYKRNKGIVDKIKISMKPHQKAMTHARVMRNQYVLPKVNEI